MRRHIEQETIACAVCQETKPRDCFTAYGRQISTCRICFLQKKQTKESRDKAKAANLKAMHGITLEDYQAMLHRQGGRCAICRRLPRPIKNASKIHTNLVVDHDHGADTIRGLLCNNCNTAIGLFEDNPHFMRAAIRYLQTYERDRRNKNTPQPRVF